MQYTPTLAYGKTKSLGNFSSSILPLEISQGDCSEIPHETQELLFSSVKSENTIITFSFCLGEKLLFVILEKDFSIDDAALGRISSLIGSISDYRASRFSAWPENGQQNAAILNKIITGSDTNRAKHAALFGIDIKPFIKYYTDAFEGRSAAGLARDAFSVICTSVKANGIVFAIDGSTALAAIFSKTPHDAQMLAGQVCAVFGRIAPLQEQNKPVFGPFANFDIDDPAAKQEISDFLATVQD